MKKKVLTLTISKQWFDMIADDKKKEEYREVKPYWIARLFQDNSNIVDVRNLASALAGRTDLLKKYIDAQRIVLKQYTHVLFINGYRKDSPRIEKEIVSITIGKPKKGLCPDKWLDTEFFIIKFKQRMTNEEFFYAHLGERVLYKGKDIGAYVAGYIEDKYIILGFNDYTGCIQCFTSKVKNLCAVYRSYRFAKLKYVEVVDKSTDKEVAYEDQIS